MVPSGGTSTGGHAVSPDLLRWRLLPEALKPGPELYDAGGIFSGGAVVRQDELYLFYTAADPQSPVLGLLRRSGRLSQTPRQSAHTRAAVGLPNLGFPGSLRLGKLQPAIICWWLPPSRGGGIVFLYSSQDLVDWKYRGEFYSETLSPGVPAFECPLYFPLDEKELLVVSSFDVSLLRDRQGRETSAFWLRSGASSTPTPTGMLPTPWRPPTVGALSSPGFRRSGRLRCRSGMAGAVASLFPGS